MDIGVQTGNWYIESKPYESIKYISECGFNAIDYNINNFSDETFDKEKLTSFFDKSITELKSIIRNLKKPLPKCLRTQGDGSAVLSLLDNTPEWLTDYPKR